MGPSVFRVVDDWLTGYANLKGHPAVRVRDKARRYKHMSHKAMMLLRASQRHVNRRSADRLERLYQRIAAQTGPMTRREHLAAKLVPAMLRYTAFKLRHNIGEQPEFTRRTFRTGKFLRLPEASLPLLDTSDIRG
jgi:hypothetical protein